MSARVLLLRVFAFYSKGYNKRKKHMNHRLIHRFSQGLKRTSRFHHNNKFLINFSLFWVDFPEILRYLCFTKRGLPFVFSPKKRSPQTTLNFALVCLWGGRAGGRCTITWLPNFHGWVVYHICLLLVLRARELRDESSPIKMTRIDSNYMHAQFNNRHNVSPLTLTLLQDRQ